MTRESSKEFADQLKMLIQDYDECFSDERWGSIHSASHGDIEEFMTQSLAAIDRIVPPSSVYGQRVANILNQGSSDGYKLNVIIGVIRALYKDIDRGFVQRFSTMIRGEVFDDFLDMANHLLDQGYKDAAAVISGSSLESHLRQLCMNHSIDTERQTNSGKRPVSADTMNVNLARAGVYNVNQQKNITFCLDIRNSAAHGKYDEYDDQQVVLMIDSVRHFIARNPQ